MALAAGTRLAGYEITGPLGAGGMGEVYRARDARLGRDVALKILPDELKADRERLRRFEREAQAVSALSHPNIVTIYDIGEEPMPYIVMELVEGRTLRELLAAGPLPVKRLLEIAPQIADGLAQAHEAGIVHRDVKPENVMISRDGVAKLLDFGLAKRTLSAGAKSSEPTATLPTEPGTVIGTVRYMSPEQAAGRPVDFRTDQFSLGSVLYEMASGKPAFSGDTNVDTLSAILHADPEPLGQRNAKAPAPLRWVIERCLAKDPKDRYASTQDLARDLAGMRERLVEVSGVLTARESVPAATRHRRIALGFGAGLVLAVLAAGIWSNRRGSNADPPLFRQLTFRTGRVTSARFAPDGQTVVYSAHWEGRPAEVFVTRIERPESRPLGLERTEVLAVSQAGEMALSLNRHEVEAWIDTGMLARMGLASVGPPREVLEGVDHADWSPDGARLAVVREPAGTSGRSRLEYPIGTVLFDAPGGYLSHPRVSLDGERVAFLEHPVRGDDAGGVAVVDRSGHKTVLVSAFTTVAGLAWAPGGRELWFAGTPSGTNRALFAVTLSGEHRALARGTGSMVLNDVTRSGLTLMTHERRRQRMMLRVPGETKERDLTWLDYSLPRDLSEDGNTVLFVEGGEAGGPDYGVFVRRSDGSPAVHLGDGDAQSLSPDGKWAIAVLKRRDGDRLVVYPTGAGETRTLPLPGFNLQRARFLPDGNRILLSASESGRGLRLYLQEFGGGRPRPVSPEGYVPFLNAISPDGRWVAARDPKRSVVLYPLDGGEPRPLSMLASGDTPCGWSTDGRALFIAAYEAKPRRLDRVELGSGRREPLRDIVPPDPLGGAAAIQVKSDGRAYTYSYVVTLSDLYLVDGLK